MPPARQFRAFGERLYEAFDVRERDRVWEPPVEEVYQEGQRQQRSQPCEEACIEKAHGRASFTLFSATAAAPQSQPCLQRLAIRRFRFQNLIGQSAPLRLGRQAL